MDTLLFNQNRIGNGLKHGFFVFCSLCVWLLVTTHVYAAAYEYEIQVDYSFDTGAVTGKEVTGYRLYREDDQVCDVEVSESQSFTCIVLGESGDYNFFLSALYHDGTASPLSSSFTFTIPEQVVAPIAPAVSVNNVISSLAENADTSAMIKVADLVVSDADGGTNNLALSGSDAGMFSIIDVELFLNAGTQLDFETKSNLGVTVEVDDPSLSGTPDDSVSLTISVVDVNERPSVGLGNMVTSLSENTNTDATIKVADIVVTDDSLGANNLSLSGSDANMFTITGSELFLNRDTILNFESRSSLAVTVQVDDPALSSGPEDSAEMTISIVDVNEPPSISLINVISSLAEDADTGSDIKVGNIVITDDALGTNSVSLGGLDADQFSIAGTGLYIKAGTVLDYETSAVLDVLVKVNDQTLAETTVDSAVLTIAITDKNEAPVVNLENQITTLAEDVDTSSAIKVSDIDLVDDALGTNNLGVSGPDADLFVISGSALYLKSGSLLDFETNAVLDITVAVADPGLPEMAADSELLSISVTDVDEPVLAAVITAGSLEGDAPFTLPLDGIKSTGTIDSYSWSFGDGQTATTATVSHTYEYSGNYTATLTVSDGAGSTHTDRVTIVATEPEIPEPDPEPEPEPEPTLVPVANISTSNAIGEAPLTVDFNGSGSTVDEQLSATYIWNFGDGHSATGLEPSHEFTSPGDYDVVLTVTDNLGFSDHATSPVLVSTPEEENELPVSTFTFTAHPDVPFTFVFDASPSSDSDGSIAAYLWDFGDGSSGEGLSTEHTYAEAGEYQVTLDVSDDRDGTSESSQTVFVTEEEALAFELGEVQVDSEWTSFAFNGSFIDPVVIAGPLSSNDTEPATVRIRNVTQSGFEIRVEEWDYLDDIHGPETFSFIVIEKGVYSLDNGVKIEAGSFNTNSTRFKSISMQQSYDVTPVILTQVMTENEKDTVTVRLRRIDPDSFQYKLQEQELNKKSHGTETIGYIAWEPGRGEMSGLVYEVGTTPQVITDDWYDLEYQEPLPSLPFFFAGMQTTAGGNTSVVRAPSIDQSTAGIKIEEEQSRDDEVRHSAEEVVGYITLGATVVQ